MTQTVEDRCLDALAAALATIDGLTVERDRTAPWEDSDLPAAALLTGDTEPVEPPMTGIDHYVVDAMVELYVGGDDDAAARQALDRLVGQAIAAVMADDTLGGVAFLVRYAGAAAVAPDRERGRGPDFSRMLRFSLHYMTAEGDPFTALAA